MDYRSHFLLLADYNLRMNNQLFDAARTLTADEVCSDMGAFFDSILGTLNHLIVGDLIWLSRFSSHSDRYTSLLQLSELPVPQSLDHQVYPSLELLSVARTRVDSSIRQWLLTEVDESDFIKPLTYKNTKGVVSERNFAELVVHLFNHQTHHRGQITTLLNQRGVDAGVTDLLIEIRDLRG
ncbi:MAG: DinB family protein [Motiliproteus sp.]